jgi:FkbM family methyltransferase
LTNYDCPTAQVEQHDKDLEEPMKDANLARATSNGAHVPSEWLSQLHRVRNVGELRDSLLARHSAFAQERLRDIAIVGAAEEGRRLAALCRGQSIGVRAIVDDSAARQGHAIEGVPVRPMDTLSELPANTPVVIASHRVLKAAERLRGMGFVNVAPFALLQVLDPAAFPPHMFYDGWLDDLFDNRDRYAALADLLADDFSRRVLGAVLGFRLTLDPAILAPIVEWELYGPADLLSYGTDEVYVDAGAFDGDSVRLFIDRVHGCFARVIAFEPDTNTFHRLAENFADEKRVEPVNAGLHRCAATLRFDNAGTRGSVLVEQGGIEIKVVGLDEVLQGERVSFIKMNIEGAELEALEGARESIRRWAPTLAISAYHRPSDLWQVAALARSLRPDYRLYFRQHDGGVIETVLYAIADKS